ncbi:MAG: hypothetical protein CVV61_05095 [Tenericutes bacterium HGW-Tenericutes-6]|nr:MAG: hypothetical protein CVV61_05095 [Tenericutes bacterium HGW-Tenericutes-6]
MSQVDKKKVLHVIRVGLIINILLAAIKLSFGFIGEAQSLISDGLNSTSDIIISLLMLFFMKVATKKPDHDHHYGHEKYEGLAYFALGLIFFAVSIYIMVDSINLAMTYLNGNLTIEGPKLFTVFISALSLVLKLLLFFYYKRAGKIFKSPTLKADAKNHFIDVWATSFTLIGLSMTQFGLIIFDYIAAFIVGIFILKLSIDVIKEAISFLVDQAPSTQEIKDIHETILMIEGVLTIDDLKVRKHMVERYVDVEIGVKGHMSLEKAHQIAEKVHHKVEEAFPDVIHCMVHVNPHHDA